MKSINFERLRPAWPQLAELGASAEAYLLSDPTTATTKMRIFVEQLVTGLYHQLKLDRPPQARLVELLDTAEFQSAVPRVVCLKMDAIRVHGNKATHGGSVSRQLAQGLLKELFEISAWLYLAHCGGKLDDLPQFQLPGPTAAEGETKAGLKREKQAALQRLATQEAQLTALLEKIAEAQEARQVAEEEASALRTQLEARGAETVGELGFDEETTRRRLIDLQLAAAGWDVGPHGAQTEQVGQGIEVHHQPTPSGKGSADYVLWDDDGKPLAVIEAKRTAEDPSKGKMQAFHYANGLEQDRGRRPIILYTNGFDIWIWDDAQGYVPRKLYGIYSKDSLQQLIFQRGSRAALDTLSPNRTTVDRLYQFNAIKRVTEKFEQGHRKALIVMATGTGKTRVAIALEELLAEANWVKRALFLCDRRELRKQAKDAFTEFTSHSAVVVRTSTAKEREHRIYLATYPAMMKVFETFDPGFFDLIIADESHRSIYNVYRDIFDWFDGLQIGLTATPVEMVSVHFP